jgi:hypothetical protein
MRKFFMLAALALGGVFAATGSTEAAYNHRGGNFNGGVCQPRFNSGYDNSGHRHRSSRDRYDVGHRRNWMWDDSNRGHRHDRRHR